MLSTGHPASGRRSPMILGILLLLGFLACLPAPARARWVVVSRSGDRPDGTHAAGAPLAHGNPLSAVNPEDPPVPEHSSARVDTSDVVRVVPDTLFTLRVGPDSVRIPYYCNRLLDTSDPEVRRGVVVLHGTLRNADTYFDAVMEAAEIAGAEGSSQIIAPQFLTEPDLVLHAVPEDVAFWAYMGWRQGDASLSTADHPRPHLISSFAVVDSILLHLARANPNLDTLIVAGHSAGGQFANRYAAGTRIEQTLAQEFGIRLRYVVSNPSTYLYLNPERWIVGTTYHFALPDPADIAECPTYDDYKYGLSLLNAYMDIGLEVLRQQYRDREVIYLLGGNDTDPNSFYLDRDCAAMFQGEQRLQRGIVFYNFLSYFYGEGVYDSHHLAIVPDVGHDQRGMFTSACGVYYLFDHGTCDPLSPVQGWSDVTTELLAAPEAQAAAWGDYDGDGWSDLFSAAESFSDRLFHNDGTSFSDSTTAPLNDLGRGVSASWADIDNDADLDLLMINRDLPNRLFRNDGGRFTNIAEGTPIESVGERTDAAWADYDLDGDLDVYLTRTDAASNVLFRNDGAGGFEAVSAPPLEAVGHYPSAAWGDFDNDGDPDLYIVRADGPNMLCRNEGDGTFTDVSAPPVNTGGNSSSACWGDYDNDGWIDLYLVNRASRNKLFHNEGGGVFSDVSPFPVNISANGRSASWGDYDNDGYLDLFLCNYGQPNRLYHNLGGEGFEEDGGYPLNETNLSICAAWADADRDGDLDIYKATYHGSNKLYRNDRWPQNRWLGVDLVGRVSNAGGVGARVRAVVGDRHLTRTVGEGAGAQAQNALTLHFGLGSATRVDTLEVTWPSGLRHRLRNIPAGQSIHVYEPNPASDTLPVSPGALELLGPLGSNPVRGAGWIGYSLPEPGPVRLSLFNAAGALVQILHRSSWEGAGPHRVHWEGKESEGGSLLSGVYFLRLESGTRACARAVVYLR